MTFRGLSDILSDLREFREYSDERNPKTVVIPEDLMKILDLSSTSLNFRICKSPHDTL